MASENQRCPGEPLSLPHREPPAPGVVRDWREIPAVRAPIRPPDPANTNKVHRIDWDSADTLPTSTVNP